MLNEIAQSLSNHKTRALLTILTVAWGVFVLVTLLGAGRGLQNGVELQFADEAVNSIWVYRGQTSFAFNGIPSQTPVRLDNHDFESVNQFVPMIDRSTATYSPQGELVTSHRDKYGTFEIQGIHPDYHHIEKSTLANGRFINQLDTQRERKVCVIGVAVKRFFFGESNAIGERLAIDGISFRVVGIFSDSMTREQEKLIFLPISTAQSVYGSQSNIDQITYTVGNSTYQQSKQSEDLVRSITSDRHGFASHDTRAISIYNNLDEFRKVTNLFKWIGIFVAVVGVGSVLTGIFSVSNIMVISVSERRREIGVRKALGASPTNITLLIVAESLAVTLFAGAVGLIASLGLLWLLQNTIEANEYMYQPDVNTPVVIGITIAIALAGTFAGFLPAHKAARIHPTEALTPT